MTAPIAAEADDPGDAPARRHVHDMRNAVGAVLSAVQVLRRTGSGSELGASALDIIERQAGQLGRLLDAWDARGGPFAADGATTAAVFDGERWPLPHAGTPPRRAVLLEREPQRLQALRHALEACGYQVLCAVDANAALRLLLSQRPAALVAGVEADDPAVPAFSRRCRAAGYAGQMVAVVDASALPRAEPLRQAGYDAVLASPPDPARLRVLLSGED